ncbi:hypothetical protein NIES25_15700 [Nostoc linckia NIES-25]|nr:hypothetical protein NIES25_15700 [Nostoc linckia NIES-25]
MNQLLKRTFLPSLMAASLAGVSLIPAQPAAADSRVIEDAAIGAGAGIVTGAITRCGSAFDNGIRGGLSGAAVNGANGLRSNRKNRNLLQDAGVGAGANILAGTFTGGCRSTWKKGVGGAAGGAAIHILRNRR